MVRRTDTILRHSPNSIDYADINDLEKDGSLSRAKGHASGGAQVPSTQYQGHLKAGYEKIGKQMKTEPRINIQQYKISDFRSSKVTQI